MGRRKIEIKAIKDDRNRSVTFLKRKGGLFKKAHELSVLCSVDVAVIIFGHNKKLYEYSSGDINETIGRHQYYGGAHEHKGPSDFAGKRDDGSDDEEVDENALEDQMSQDHLAPNMQNQPGFGHMRQAPSASPPVGNGAMPYPVRRHTPQPPGMGGSRPSSRNAQHIPRPGSNLGQHQVAHAPQMQNGYAYMHGGNPYGPPQQHQMPMQNPGQHPGQQPAPHPQFQYTQQGPQHPMPAPYMQDRRPSSVTPQYPNDRPQSHPQQQPQPPQPPQLQTQPPPSRQSQSPPQQENEQQQNYLQPQQPKPLSVKNSKSIFTPIDDNRSLLAGGWDFGSTRQEPSPIKQESKELNRSHSVDVASFSRNSSGSGPSAPPVPRAPQPAQTFPQPQRTQSTTSLGGQRPRLKVQIPSEHSGSGDEGDDKNAEGTAAGTGTSGTSPRPLSQTQETPARTESSSHGSGVVLPPPSPSASALLSAGATGPPNPFARPLPPGASGATGAANSSAYQNNNSIETPISALPSRFVADQFLPSPSSFYPEWGFGSGQRSAGDGNMLPSPLNFQTPIQGTGPSFGGPADDDGKKRKTPDGDGEQVEAKRVKA